MKTLKEALAERGISLAHIARMHTISPQAVNKYKDSPVLLGHSYVDVLKKTDKKVYNESGKRISNAVYELVRTFDL